MSFLVATRSASYYEDDFFFCFLLRQYVSVVFHDNLFVIFHDNPSDVFCDNLLWALMKTVFLLSYVAVSCLTLSSFVFFYHTSFAAWVSSVLTMIIFRHYFSWILIPFKNLLHAIPNLRFRHTIPWIWGGILEIYWAMRPKPSVGLLFVINANLVLVRLGLSSIYTQLRSHCNNQAL